jgi:rsbT co-antagonist protein RsbR
MAAPPNESIAQSDWTKFEFLQSTIDTIADPIFVKDLQHRFAAVNRAFCELMGHPREALIGRSDPDFVPPEQVELFWRNDDMVTASGQPHENEEPITDGAGNLRTLWTRKFPLRDTRGQVIGLTGMITDITAIKRRQEQVERLEVEIAEKMTIIEVQSSLLDQLSVPVIQIWDSILLLPLIGVIDSRRASQVTESLLVSIARAGARFVIVDITGVPMVDTSVAGYLIRAVQAAQLLGSRSVLVGISPEIAQTLVGLGVDFSHILTRATLQNGLEYALKQLNYAVGQAVPANARASTLIDKTATV